MNIQTTLDSWLEANTTACGPAHDLSNLTETLGYRDLNEFLDDNSSCVDQIYNWIGKNGNEEWKAALAPVLRDDIQNLLDKKIIELEHDYDNRYILTNTKYAIIARFNDKGYLVGSIVVNGENIALYDENDKAIPNSDDCDYLEAFKHF